MSINKIIETVKKFQAQSKTVDASYHLTSDDPRDNLVKGIRNWEDIEKDLKAGKGGELEPRKRYPPKFLSVRSSAALCVNNFAPFKEYHMELSFMGISSFVEACFEKEQPTGLHRPTEPHLDFYLENEKTIIGIESKFLEYLNFYKAPNHPSGHRYTEDYRENNLDAYLVREKLHYLPDGFFDNIIEFYSKCSKDDNQRLDVAQLIKHSIGLLKNRHDKGNKQKVVLIYLYWEPLDWKTIHPLFNVHRDNINEFECIIKQFEPLITFVPLSYLEFWQQCENDVSLHESIKEHIGRVVKRYRFAINS